MSYDTLFLYDRIMNNTTDERYNMYLYMKQGYERRTVCRLINICWDMVMYGSYKFKMDHVKRVPLSAWDELIYKLEHMEDTDSKNIMFINTNLEYIAPPQEIILNSADNMFSFSKKLKYIDMSKFKFMNQGLMQANSMFRGSLFPNDTDLSGLKLEHANNMFMDCINEYINLETLNLENISDMSSMFSGAHELKKIRLNYKSFGNDKLMIMDKTFYNCKSLFINPYFFIDLMGINNRNKIAASNMMLYGCEKVKSICLNGLFDNVYQYQHETFSYSGITFIDLHGYYTYDNSVTDILSGCDFLIHVIFSSESPNIDLKTNKSYIV